MKEIRLASKIISTLVKDRMREPIRLVIDTASVVIRSAVVLILYWYVFHLNNSGLVNGATYSVVVWGTFFSFAFSVLQLRGVATTISKDVKSGNIELLLSKPVSYLLYRVWWQIGSTLYPFIIASVFGFFALVFAVGVPASMQLAIFLPSFLAAFVLGTALSLVIYMTIGLLAFWMEETRPVFWIVDKTIMILGGLYLPIAFLPKSIYNFSVYSPFGASRLIAHTVYDSWKLDWAKFIGVQLAWLLLFYLVVWVLFSRAKRRVSVNGG